MPPSIPSIQPETVVFAGGMDQITPFLEMKPGTARDGVNFECSIPVGYSRIAGYERFDGKLKPSDALYSVLQLQAMLSAPIVGSTLTGNTTGTTATIIAVDTNLEAPHLILTLIIGPGFSTTETVNVGTTLIGTATETTVSISNLLNAQYLNLAADVYRALITAVPGSGDVRGVFSMVTNGVHEVFAFRDNAGVTAVELYKSSSSGWVLVPFLYEISFTAGAVATPNDGDTLTKGGVTAVIKRVMLESGSWNGGTAAGRLVIAAPSGGNFSAGAATIGTTTLTLSGIQTAITMLPGGTFEFDEGNFFGQNGSKRIYGCDKVNRGFEFDGVTLAPIKTGLSPDAPAHVQVHQNHLFFSFKSSLINSGIGAPYTFTSISGSSEYACGDTVNGMKVQPGSQESPTMFIVTGSGVKVLYGSSALSSTNPFRLDHFSTLGAGGAERTLQNLDRSYYMSSIGIIDIARVQEFGNFNPSAITFPSQPYLTGKRGIVSASCIDRQKSQYRLFCSDGSGYYLTIVNGQAIGGFPVFFANPVKCVWNGQLSNGNDVTYFGSSNGMVYQLERGSSFDGQAIDFYFTPAWLSNKTPRILKSYRYASLEIQSNAYAAIDFEYTLGFGVDISAKEITENVRSSFSGAPHWDSGITWDAFTWDGTASGPVTVQMAGDGENVQPRLGGSSDYLYPFSVSSLTLHSIARRVLRHQLQVDR
jgi:hypothetical protein